MTHSYGYRAGTRKLFRRDFRKKGYIALSTYAHVYKMGDHVDIKVNSAQHKGMAHKVYHGKTGVVFNITPRALGVEIFKRVRGRIMAKRINVRLEHVQPSKCQDDLKARIARNEKQRAIHKETGVYVPLKRTPEGPRKAHFISGASVKDIAPARYEFTGKW
eukprot:gnl/Dysnectes_brevis/532_a589_6185.p1 GENE.gnl/Dysnectes_brevis/532_a589_6185~~gnl/Dysnectes_brevis/532_a589_6185.p1  ORF type:complete len:161 (+),score=37.88 gnl/Dysnectes_brevis/532_a589_6185:352-834(+)